MNAVGFHPSSTHYNERRHNVQRRPSFVLNADREANSQAAEIGLGSSVTCRRATVISKSPLHTEAQGVNDYLVVGPNTWANWVRS